MDKEVVPVHEKQVVPQSDKMLHTSDGLESAHYYNAAGAYNQQQYMPISTPASRTICGFPRRAFLCLMAMFVVLILALSIGLGVGLGTGLRKDAASPATTSNVSASTTATAAANTATASSTTSGAATTITPASSQKTAERYSLCPSQNGTTTSTPSTVYNIYCNANINAPGKSDLSNGYQPTFDSCVSICSSMTYFQKRNDVSAVYEYNGTTPGSCWCVGGTASNQSPSIVGSTYTDLALIKGIISQ